MDWWRVREFIQAQRKCGYNSILLWKLQFPTAYRRLFSVLSRSAVRQTTGEGCQRDTSYVTLAATSRNMCKRCFNTLYKVWRRFNPNCCFINLKTNLKNVVFCLLLCYPKQKQEQQQKLKLKLWYNCSICRFHRQICTHIHIQKNMYVLHWFFAQNLQLRCPVGREGSGRETQTSSHKQSNRNLYQLSTLPHYTLLAIPYFHTYFLIVFGASWIIPEFICFFYCFSTKRFVVELWLKIAQIVIMECKANSEHVSELY